MGLLSSVIIKSSNWTPPWTRNNIPRPKLTLLSHFTAKKSDWTQKSNEPKRSALSDWTQKSDGPKRSDWTKSQIRTNPIEDSGKAPHVRRLFLGKEHNRSLKSQKSLILTLSMLCQNSALQDFRSSGHRDAFVEEFESMKKEIKNLENSPCASL